ncbi:hypothetical protein, partial [Saccharothrix variisporea]|uniref:hypothetical protein n=1 Tax=Saccharothrix variisporea TaxID=543527 RepID=UPI0037C7A11A
MWFEIITYALPVFEVPPRFGVAGESAVPGVAGWQSTGEDTTQLGLLAFVISVWPARRATTDFPGCSRKF